MALDFMSDGAVRTSADHRTPVPRGSPGSDQSR